MAFQTQKVAGAKEDLSIFIEDSDSTAESNISGGTGSAVFRVTIDARNNPTEDTYTRLYNKSSPTVGTDDAEIVLPVRRGTKITWYNPRGTVFSSNISVATVTNKGATSGNTAPTGQVDVTIDLLESPASSVYPYVVES